MKKILLFIFSLIVSTTVSFSQSLTIIYEGAPISNEDTVQVNGELPNIAFYEIVSHARIKNNTDREVSVKVERITLDTVPGSMNQFCWVQCFAPWISVSPLAYKIPAYDTTADEVFSGHYLPQNKMGTSILKYVFYLENNPDDKVSFVVRYVVSPASIEDIASKIKFGNAYPNPANNKVSFNYDFPIGVTTASLKIYNLLGQAVAEQSISESTGRLEMPVNNLNEGVYLYSLTINNSVIVTKKLIIRR
ncbi:MAG: T9SS type A sorting domain-containing protein [Bacteroidetes bacterium]|nr:T9SS type A sorting domain-containing protein [Bacteroidota bacterium]